MKWTPKVGEVVWSFRRDRYVVIAKIEDLEGWVTTTDGVTREIKGLRPLTEVEKGNA